MPTRDEVADLVRPLRRGHASVTDGDPASPLWWYAGRDAAGTRIAIFNDADAPRRAVVRPASLPTEVATYDPATGAWAPAAPEHAPFPVDLAPGELVCLHLADGGAPVPDDLVLATGWTLRAGSGAPRPISVHAGWERQGFPHFSGTGTYAVRFAADGADLPGTAWDLVFPAVRTTAEAELNGVRLGARGWPPYRFAVPRGLVRATGNELRVRVASSAANHYYAGSGQQGNADPSGLLAAPYLTPRA